MMDRINSLNLRYVKVRDEDRQGIPITNIIMTRKAIRIGLDQRVEIGEFHLVGGYSMDKIIETGQDMNRIIQTILGEKISEEIWEWIRITEDRIIGMDIKEVIKMRIMKEVERGLKRQYWDNNRRNDRSSSSRSRSGSRANTSRDTFRFYKHIECNYFAKDCGSMTNTVNVQYG